MSDEEKNPSLGNALRALGKERIFVPAERDERLLGMVRQHFQEMAAQTENRETASDKGSDLVFHLKRKEPEVRLRPNRAQKWLPLAASILIAGTILFFSKPGSWDRADVNQDGTVDVIDALLLAEQVRDGGGRDVNGDGKADERDAAEIAARVVDLDRSGT